MDRALYSIEETRARLGGISPLCHVAVGRPS
jgi:hypothetical protein